MPARISPLRYLAALVALVLVWYWAGRFDTSGPGEDREAMIGTWTDPDGPPGNSIRFFHVPVDVPGSPVVQAYDGHATVVNMLGKEKAPARWNYGHWDPLVLNFSIGRRAWHVAVRKVDEDHLLVRFGTDAEEMYRPDALDHPDTRRLTRTGREPRLGE